MPIYALPQTVLLAVFSCAPTPQICWTPSADSQSWSSSSAEPDEAVETDAVELYIRTVLKMSGAKIQTRHRSDSPATFPFWWRNCGGGGAVATLSNFLLHFSSPCPSSVKRMSGLSGCVTHMRRDRLFRDQDSWENVAFLMGALNSLLPSRSSPTRTTLSGRGRLCPHLSLSLPLFHLCSALLPKLMNELGLFQLIGVCGAGAAFRR